MPAYTSFASWFLFSDSILTLTPGMKEAALLNGHRPDHSVKGSEWQKKTQGQSVGSGEKTRRKFSSTSGRVPRYRLSPDHF